MTPSEEFVAELCEKSFLPFWSFPNPLGKKGKELCDVLVVCENTIIIISVKDIKVSDHPDEKIQYERWQKKAVSSSVDQIYGAERFLKGNTKVLLKDKITEVQLPETSEREIFRIAVAFGKEDNYPLENGNFGNGFVHVFDEESTFTVLNELDTFPDFVNYLRAKENFLRNKIVSVPREIDFLALYLATGLKFDFVPDSIVLDNNIWEQYVESDEYKNWQIDIKQSFIWDEIVSHLHRIHIVEKKQPHMISDLEIATRIITMEPRMNRIELGIMFIDAMKKKLRGRIIQPFPGSNHSYVMPLTSKNWDSKEKELELRCLIARKENPTAQKVIGIAMGRDRNGQQIFDLFYLDIEELDKDVVKRIDNAKEELGYFTNPVISRSKNIRK